MRTHLMRNAIAYAALFVALGGTSYAAATLARNSVGTMLRTGAVTVTKIRDGSADDARVRARLRCASRSRRSRAHPGPAGLAGPAGSAGSPRGTAVCTGNKRAIGGGAMLVGTSNSNDHLLSSRPGVNAGTGGFGNNSNVPSSGDTPTAWTAEMYSVVTGRTPTVYVICAAP